MDSDFKWDEYISRRASRLPSGNSATSSLALVLDGERESLAEPVIVRRPEAALTA